jgi:hypothetical protein
MKNGLLFLLLIAFGTANVVGQQSKMADDYHKLPYTPTPKNSRLTDWYNYGEVIYTENQTDVLPFGRYLFPDSLPVYFTSGGDEVRPFTHHWGQIFDPYSEVYLATDAGPVPPGLPYTIDAIKLPYAYYRQNPSTNPDTIIVQYYRQNALVTVNLTGGGSTRTARYTPSTNLGVNSFRTDTILLTQNDVATEGELDLENLDIAISANQRFAVTFSFRAGHSYSLNDTLDANLTPTGNPVNSVILFGYQDRRGLPDDARANFDMVANTSIRYNTNAQGWNGYFLPGNIWTAGGNPVDNHLDVSFQVSSIAGISNNKSDNFRLVLAPNPVTKGSNTMLNIDAAKQSTVSISISDISGKQISMENHNLAAGKQQIKLDTQSLTPGVYFVTIGDNEKGATTTKFVVTR